MRISTAIYCAGLLSLAGCGDEASDKGAQYGGTGAVGGGGLGGNLGNPGGSMSFGGTGGSGGMMAAMTGGGGGVSGAAGMMAAMTGGMGGSGGTMMTTGGMGGSGGTMTTGGMGGSGGMMATGGSGGSDMVDGMSVSGIPDEELQMLRQVCVDEINMYRATISLAPLARASADRELCSDQGAKKDGDSGDAHSSAGRNNPCVEPGGGWGAFPNFAAQNTCPGYPVGGFGSATIADALKTCLRQMWDEGEPPQGEEQCIAEYRAGNTACFLAHGHYINMKGSSSAVACGFYKMMNGRYWMNQDFVQ